MADRLWALSVSVAAVVAGTMPALSADFEDPLAPLMAKGLTLCFGRDYSPEHLAQHPKQTTKSILLAFRDQRIVTIELTSRTGAPKQIAADCLWWDRANFDTSDRKIFPKFDKPAGFACMVALGNTDQEGGYIVIDPARDATSLTMFVQSLISVYDRKLGKAKSYSVELGEEDQTFTLKRIEPKACASLRQ